MSLYNKEAAKKRYAEKADSLKAYSADRYKNATPEERKAIIAANTARAVAVRDARVSQYYEALGGKCMKCNEPIKKEDSHSCHIADLEDNTNYIAKITTIRSYARIRYKESLDGKRLVCALCRARTGL